MRRANLMAGFLLLLIGCAQDQDKLRAVHRFTDPDLRAHSRADFGTGWNPESTSGTDLGQDSQYHLTPINNDYRYVLANPASALLSGKPDLTIPEQGPLKLLPPLPANLADAEEVALLPRIRVSDEWIDLPAVSTRPIQGGQAWWIPINLDVPDAIRGKPALLHVHAYGLRWAAETRIETAEVPIPTGAVFEVAIGLVNPLKEANRSKFRIEACEGANCRPLLEEHLTPGPERGDVPWKRVRADLNQFGGKTIRFVFHTALEDSAPIARMFPLWAHPAVYAPSPPPPKSKASNVILISLDTLSARHLPLYGYDHDTAPKMTETFGAGGVVFEHCVAAGTATVPSHMTMFTGVYPLENNMTDGMGAVVKGAVPIASLARNQGVETAAFTEDGWISVGLGFGRGFDQFVEDRSPNVMAPEGHVARTFGSAREWMAAHRDKSFFLFLHTFQVHDPYAPPLVYRDMFKNEEVDRKMGTAPEQIAERIGYDQEIRYVDDELDLLMQDLETLGIADSTTVIVTGDHGEAFGEHGYILHSNYPYEEVSHVPLMMRGPGIGRGVRVEELVGHIDFMPTLLEMFGIQPPHSNLRGKSLLEAASGSPRTAPPTDRVMYTESWGTYAMTSKRELVPFLAPALTARRGSEKLIRYRTETGYRYEAFDLVTDFHERNDLFESSPDRFRDLKTFVDTYEEKAALGKEFLISRGDAAPGEIRLDPDQEEKLRALGYLQ
jgi:arylsulfatase A-like enzyme